MSSIWILLIIAIVAVVAFYVIDRMKMPSPIDMIVRIIVGLIILLYLLGHFAPGLHLPS